MAPPKLGRRAVVILILTIVAIAACRLVTDPVASGSPSRPPGGGYVLGTTPQGVSVLPLVAVAAARSVGYALLATAVTLVVGVLVGGHGGLRPNGPADRLQTAAASLVDTLSPLLLATCFVAVFPRTSAGTLAVVLGLIGYTSVAPIVRHAVLDVRHSSYYEAARSIGCPPAWLARHYLMPAVVERVIAPLIGVCTMSFGTLGAIEFLGVGLRREATLGSTIFDAFGVLTSCPHYFLAVTGAFLILTLGFATAAVLAGSDVGDS